jgi:3-deoxy-D-manno-octulosonate 8-phosphate phosphatase (KDO 8-P phosphatase)
VYPLEVIEDIIFDLDGVFTDGTFYYSVEGKNLKKFGSHDAQAINICKPYFNIHLISADSRGYLISESRSKDMGLILKLVPEKERANWIKNNFVMEKIALVVDSFTDIPSLPYAIRSFAPSDSHPALLERVTDRLICGGGKGAVAEVLEKLLYDKTKKHLWDFL